MIGALMVLVAAVVVLGWLMAALAFFASLVSIIPRTVDHPGVSGEDRVSPRPKSCAGDDRFLGGVGIRL